MNYGRAMLVINLIALAAAGGLLWVFFKAACWAVYA